MVATRPDRRAHEPEPSPAVAIERVIEATKELVEQRAQLLRLDLEAGARRGLRAGLWGVLAVGSAILAWLAALGLAFELIANRASSEVALAVIAGAHGLFAAVFAWQARREATEASR